MITKNTANDASTSDNFEKIKDIIPPQVENRNIPAEYLITDNFLVPGVITQYFEEHVLFKPNLSDEIFNVPYNKIRHIPDIVIRSKYEVGNKVQVYWLHPKLKLHGWTDNCTITSYAKDTYVAKLDFQYRSVLVIQQDKIRAITTGRESLNDSSRAVAWSNRAVSFADMRTWEYENFIKVYYGKGSTKKSTDATGNSAVPKNDHEDTIFFLILLIVLFLYFDLF